MSTAPKVRERAIRFTDDEVLRLLGMPEVLLYRPIKLHQFHRSTTPGYDWQFRNKQGGWEDYRETELIAERCRFGKPGDRLWVRETFARRLDVDPATEPEKARHYALYRADGTSLDEPHWHSYPSRWTPSIHMPRWASRLVFEIEHVGVQCLCSEDLWVLSLRRLEVAHGTL